MRPPRWKDIKAEEAEHGHPVFLCTPPGGHNDRLFKTYWRVFTRHSKWEGDDFLEHAPLLETHEMEELLEYHKARGEHVWLYPQVWPRWDPGNMPWDLDHPRWRNVTKWAPALKDEVDKDE